MKYGRSVDASLCECVQCLKSLLADMHQNIKKAGASIRHLDLLHDKAFFLMEPASVLCFIVERLFHHQPQSLSGKWTMQQLRERADNLGDGDSWAMVP